MSHCWSLASATTLSAIALSGPALAQGAAAPAPTPPPAVQPAPTYQVLRREGVESASPDEQTLNVACPKGLSAYGAGYGANVHRTFGAGATPSESFLDAGLAEVVSRPAANGSSWTVTGKPAIAPAADSKWKLWVALICAAAPPAPVVVQ